MSIKISILCNSYPTKKNPFNQIFIQKTEHALRKKGNTVKVGYNKVFNFWGDANKVKNPVSNIFKYFIYAISMLSFGIRELKKSDVLFPQGIVFATYVAVLFKKITGIPVVCYIHGGDLNKYYNKQKGIIYDLVKYSLNNCDYIIANSSDIYIKTKSITTNKNIEIISPGIDLNVMKPIPESDLSLETKKISGKNKIVLLAAGNAIERKGFDILLKAYANLDIAVKDKTHLVILTEGPEKRNYENYIKNTGLQEYVSLLNKKEPSLLNEYNNIADLFIFPSREEPLGLVGLEAMAAGTYVIGANVGGIKEFVKDNVTGSLFEKESDKELKQKIEYAVENIDPIKANKPAIIEEAKKHSISQSVNQLLLVFNKVIGQ